MARFPDSRILRRVSSTTAVTSDLRPEPSDSCDASLAAYSGGTVWASHPLRVAAGVERQDCQRPRTTAPDERGVYRNSASCLRLYLFT